jgi:glycosyltransferase involved in cell wall biosynthesis
LKKLIIQIPCYNEEEILGITLDALPRSVPGFDLVEWLVVDDGSLDSTIQVALDHGVDHVVRHLRNQGLARTFMTGIHACLDRGASVIVNTDADNQYDARDIPALVAPIVEGRADIVIGARPIDSIRHFSLTKRILEKLGSWVVRVASRTQVPDAPSGFRALSRAAAGHIMVFNDHTYTLEMIIQAGQKNMAMLFVPVRVNENLRPSRLVRSVPGYLYQSVLTVIRIFILYRPFFFFVSIGSALLVLGAALGVRYLWFLSNDPEAGHVQSLILAAVLLIVGFTNILVSFLADLIAANRRMLEELLARVRRTSPGSDRRRTGPLDPPLGGDE